MRYAENNNLIKRERKRKIYRNLEAADRKKLVLKKIMKQPGKLIIATREG